MGHIETRRNTEGRALMQERSPKMAANTLGPGNFGRVDRNKALVVRVTPN